MVQERRREGRRNGANVVRIISREWRAWILRGTGFQKISPTDTRISFQGKNAPDAPPGGLNTRRTLPKEEGSARYLARMAAVK